MTLFDLDTNQQYAPISIMENGGLLVVISANIPEIDTVTLMNPNGLGCTYINENNKRRRKNDKQRGTITGVKG